MLFVSNDHATYVSKELKTSLFASFFPSFCFYVGFLRILFQSSLKARNGTYHDDAWQASSVRMLRLLESVGVRFDISGMEYIAESDEPVVFVGNHLSVLETTILPSLIVPYKPVTYVVKKSLLEYPVFKHVMRSRDPIAVSRDNPRQDLKTVMEQGRERLVNGISVIVFPQTTRAVFGPGKFSSIGVKLAKKAGVKVVPVALLTDAWGTGKRWKDFGPIDPGKKVYFAFGKPLPIEGKGNEEHQRIITFIQEKMACWQE